MGKPNGDPELLPPRGHNDHDFDRYFDLRGPVLGVRQNSRPQQMPHDAPPSDEQAKRNGALRLVFAAGAIKLDPPAAANLSNFAPATVVDVAAGFHDAP